MLHLSSDVDDLLLTGGRHYSIESATRRPCILKFEGSLKEITKAEKLIKSSSVFNTIQE